MQSLSASIRLNVDQEHGFEGVLYQGKAQKMENKINEYKKYVLHLSVFSGFVPFSLQNLRKIVQCTEMMLKPKHLYELVLCNVEANLFIFSKD